MPDELAPKRGRGRPKGTGGNKRPDSTAQLAPGDNRKFIQHDMRMWDWPSVDMSNPKAVSDRIVQYFNICTEDDMKPSVAGLALAFGIDRRTLWTWINGSNSSRISPESLVTLKKAYQILNAQMENYMQNGKINPVAGIFLMKNNMGYEDKQEMVLTPNNALGDSVDQKQLEERIAGSVVVESDENS